jgi:hypothetical protein
MLRYVFVFRISLTLGLYAVLEFSTARKDPFMPERKHLTPEQKVSILRRHLVEDVAVERSC